MRNTDIVRQTRILVHPYSGAGHTYLPAFLPVVDLEIHEVIPDVASTWTRESTKTATKPTFETHHAGDTLQ